MKHGAFIAIEGIDGCGKSTLIGRLKEKVSKEQIPARFTKEPGGSTIGISLRTMLQQQTAPLHPSAEFLLFAADRAQHMQEVVKPGLVKGELVITDRCADSSLAYQGYGLGLDTSMIQTINDWAMCETPLDLVIYLHITPDIALERIRKSRSELTTFEQRPDSFWHNVYNGYEAIFEQRDNVFRIDATQDPNTVLDHAWQALQKVL